jgi:hypothetical protein
LPSFLFPSGIPSPNPTIVIDQGAAVTSRSLIGAMAVLALIVAGGFMMQCKKKNYDNDEFDDDDNEKVEVEDDDDDDDDDDELVDLEMMIDFTPTDNVDTVNKDGNSSAIYRPAFGVPCFNWDGCDNGIKMREEEGSLE